MSETPVSPPLSGPPLSGLTVVVLTLDEAGRLPRCLGAVPKGVPVVVVDSGSCDDTVAVARAHGAAVAVNPWPGFSAQRNFALEACGVATPWTLFVDADEVFPGDFYRWFAEAAATGRLDAADVAMVPSELVFEGRTLRHAPGYPIHHPRLVRTRGVRFVPNFSGHGEAVAGTPRLTVCPVAYRHFFYDGDLGAWLRKHVGLARQEVDAAAASGLRPTGRSRLDRLGGRGVLRIPLRFVYHYLVRGGFRDGGPGLRYALMYGWYEATKWLLRLQAQADAAKAARSAPALVVTHIAPARGFGGVAESVGAIVRAWARAGRTFTLVSSDGSRGAPLAAADLALPPTVTVRLYRARWAVRWGFGPGAPAAVWTACRHASSVYICGIATWPVTLAALACRFWGRPYLIAPHGGLMPAHVARIRRDKPLKWLFYRLLVFPALRRAQVVRATSALERAGILAVLPGLSVEVVANGVELAELRPVPPVIGNDGRRFCYAGRFSPEKGVLRFLDMWLRGRRPGDRLVLAGGGDGDYARAVARLAAAAGDAVIVTGWLERREVLRHMALCDFVVLPSGLEGGDVRENFGNAAAEALALGRPVMTTRGLAWDDLESLGAGLVFDSDDAAVLAVIERARTLPPGDYAAMAEAAAAYARRHLEIERTAARFWSLLSAPAGA